MKRAWPGPSVWIGAVVFGLAAATAHGASAAGGPHGKIAFVRYSVAAAHPHIYSLTLGRKTAKRLPLLGPATAGPAWSANGSRLAFVAGNIAPGSRDITGTVRLYV